MTAHQGAWELTNLWPLDTADQMAGMGGRLGYRNLIS